MVDNDFPSLDPKAVDLHFPMPDYRDGQKEAILYAINGLNSGKKFIILECPTGSGKSAIGMTLCNMVYDSYYLTVTKILQDQLIRDFKDLILLKGRSAYPCTFYDRFGSMLVDRKIYSVDQLYQKKVANPSCNEGFCKTIKAETSFRISKSQCEKCFLRSSPASKHRMPQGDQINIGTNIYSACPYYEQVYTAINSRQVAMNFSSFIYQTSLTKRFGNPRDLLIIDEAHNIEQQVLDFVSITINDDLLKDHGYFIPHFDEAIEYYHWFKQIDLYKILSSIKSLYEASEDHNKTDEIDKLILKIEIFNSHIMKEGAEWVVNYQNDLVGKDRQAVRSVELKPVFATGFAHDILFRYAKRVVLMSATILDVDVMCRSLGIDRKEVAAYRMKNRFPLKNRPIYIKPAAKMVGGKDKMNLWMPKLLKSVEEISAQYEGERGIIHTHNFAIMDAVIQGASKKLALRLLSQKEFPNKSDLLEYHSKQKDSIIIAPAMHEGVDLRDDLSRFQIICKVPYPNFYDNPQLARRIEVDQRYYSWLVSLKLIQSYGRSIRSETDYADTYIIDEAIFKFLKDAKSMLPNWFTEALIHP